jgi:hypothetical protein
VGEKGEKEWRRTRKEFCGYFGRQTDGRQKVRGVAATTAMLLFNDT